MMKAALLTQIDSLSLQMVPIPEIDDNSALMRVRACAVCASDIKILHKGHPRLTYPQIVGHEFSGEIVEVGKNVTRFKVGDRVSCGCDISCGVCKSCKNGWATHCDTPHAFGHDIGGGFAEYCLLPQYSLEGGPVHKIPDHLSFEEAALAEPFACIINAMELIRIRWGDRVVIIGAGPLGCLMIEAVRSLGASKVILIDRSADRLSQAQIFGADAYINCAEEDMDQKVMALTDNIGADVVITATPAPDNHLDALRLTRTRGRICFFGGLIKGTFPKDFDTNVIHYKELTVVGAHGSNSRQHQLAVDLIGSGSINVKPMITAKFPLDDILKAYALTEARVGLRNVVIP